jgi:hypothetical protein
MNTGRGPIAIAGLLVWVVALVWLPSGVSVEQRILLLAPLVIVPQLLGAVPLDERPLPAEPWMLFLAGLPTALAMALPAGDLAAGLAALPWAIATVALGVAAAVRGLRSLPWVFAPASAPTLGHLVAFGFLAVGGAFLLFERLAIQPGGFSVELIVLTAVHFQFAGFGLVTVAALLARRLPAMAVPIDGLTVGIPITALGFVAGSAPLNALGATITGLSGIGVALALLIGRSAATGPWRPVRHLAGIALLIGMPLGIAWSVSLALGFTFLDIERMARIHGSLNATAVLLVALAYPRQSA